MPTDHPSAGAAAASPEVRVAVGDGRVAVGDDEAGAPAAAPVHAGRLIALLLALVPFSQIPLDAYSPALPQMVEALNANPTLIQNTVTAYMLGMSFALVPAGLLADAFGRRVVVLAGMILLIAMSAACALAASAEWMLAFRFVQGLGGSVCLVVGYAIAADVFRGAKLTSVVGLLGAAWGLAPVLAPAVGGLLVDVMSWRMIFVLIGVMAAVVTVAVYFGLPETLAPARRTPVDLRKTLSVAGTALSNRSFVCYTLVFGAMASAQLVVGVVAPFLYQDGLGFSPAGYGIVAFLLGGANLAGELGCSYFAGRATPRRLGFAVFGVYVLGALALFLFGLAWGTEIVTLSLGCALVLAACGLLCPLMYGMTLGLFDRNLGLIGGMTTAACYFIVSGAMAVAAALPDHSPGPMGGLFVVLGIVAGGLLFAGLPRAASHQQATTP